MFQMSGYLQEADADIVKPDQDFLVTACGHYRLIRHPSFRTERPNGRQDYQLVYLAGGMGHFSMEGQALTMTAGGAALYRPGQPQDYYYRLEEAPDIYWMHFTGRRAEGILKEAGLTGASYQTGVKAELPALFDRVIREMQVKRPAFSPLCDGCGLEILSTIGREHAAGTAGDTADRWLDEVLYYFHQNFQRDIPVEDCAKRFNMSESWFIRSFRERTGVSPLRYLTDIRLYQAKELLASTSLNVGEIAALVGYDNPLYFSRVFHKYAGVSPRGYRAQEKKL